MFAEVNRLKALQDGRPADQAKGYGIWLAKVVAGRRYGMRRMWIGSVAIPAERALGPIGFEPALWFDSLTIAGVHLMRVKRAPDGRLATDACTVAGVRPGLLIRASQRRRH